MSHTTQLPETSKNHPNRDLLSDAPGAHPIGTGIGTGIGAALGGVATGAAVGTVAGPVGTAVGAVIGTVVGGLMGKAAAEEIDPTFEEDYWRSSFHTRPYANGASFDDFSPAYRYGVTSYLNYPDASFDDVESNLARDWNVSGGNSKLVWADARIATREAWDRLIGRIEGTRGSI